jgi:hypothetical protein
LAVRTVAVALVASAASGCIRGSLASSTGPNGPELWSTDDTQQVHVGETVDFSFILLTPMQRRPLDPYGYADYCIAELQERRIVSEPDLGGHFRFSSTMPDAEPGDEIELIATAYRQYGARDFLKVGDTWLRGESPIDEPDRKVCSDEINLVFYQARLQISLPGGAAPLDPESGKLELIKRDGTVSSIFLDRPQRPGFVVQGPDAAGSYTVLYEPRGDELNPSGQTTARLVIYDLAGHPHSAEMTIPTP